MLVFGSTTELNSVASEISVRDFGHYDARFSIQDELLHWAMKSNPTLLNGVGERLFLLVGNQHSCVPSGASVEHVKDDMFVDEEEVTLNLLVEGVGDVDTAHVVGSWICPHSADLTRVTDLWNEIQYLIWDSNSFQEPAHDLSRDMPPSHMELAQREPVSSNSSCSEESHHPTDIKIRPIGRIGRILA